MQERIITWIVIGALAGAVIWLGLTNGTSTVETVVVEENTNAVRCEAALELRRTALNKFGSSSLPLVGTDTGVREAYEKAEREIRRYC